jgi:hypothetical protein
MDTHSIDQLGGLLWMVYGFALEETNQLTPLFCAVGHLVVEVRVKAFD